MSAGELWPNSMLTDAPFRDLQGSERLVVMENGDPKGVPLPASYKYRDGKSGELVRPQFLIFSAQQRTQERWRSIMESKMSLRWRFADWVTAPSNPRFAMVGAARVWTWLFGPVNPVLQNNWREDAKTEVVLTESMRGMDCREAPGSWGSRGDFEVGEKDPLFGVLRDEFIACKFDLREMTRIVARTVAYQREAMDLDVYAPLRRLAPLVRRIPGEVIWDSLVGWQPDDAPPDSKMKSIDERQVPGGDHALRILGRGSREWTDESMPLVSFSNTRLMSGGNSVLRAAESLAGPDGLVMDSEAIIRRLFLSVLSREPQARELAACPCCQPRQSRLFFVPGQQLRQFIKVLEYWREYLFRFAKACQKRSRCRTLVKFGHRSGEFGDLSSMQSAVSTEVIQAAGLGKAAHPDRELDGRAGATDLRVFGRASDANDFQVDLRRETAIQVQFGFAAGTPLLERAVVEKGQNDRLLDLVHVITCQQQP